MKLSRDIKNIMDYVTYTIYLSTISYNEILNAI